MLRAASLIERENRKRQTLRVVAMRRCAFLTRFLVLPLLFGVGVEPFIAHAQTLIQPPAVRQVQEQREPIALELPAPIITSQTQFDVPFNTDDTTGRLIEIQLYVSTDLGKSWNLYARQSPLVKQIPFQSVGDGEYLFALKTLDRDRQLLPTGPPMPTLRIVVDTRKPELQMRIDPDKSGRIAAAWHAADFNLDRQSLVLSFRAQGPNQAATWYPIPSGSSPNAEHQADPGVFQDRIVWWPDVSADAIVVKAEIKDLAGNEAVVYQPIGLSALRGASPEFNVASQAASTLTPPNAAESYAENTLRQSNRPGDDQAVASAGSAGSSGNSAPVDWPVDPLHPGGEPNFPPGYHNESLVFGQGNNGTHQPSGLALSDPFSRMLSGRDSDPPSLQAAVRPGDLAANNISVSEGSTLAPNGIAGNDSPTRPLPFAQAQAGRSTFIPQSQLLARSNGGSSPGLDYGQVPSLISEVETNAPTQNSSAAAALPMTPIPGGATQPSDPNAVSQHSIPGTPAAFSGSRNPAAIPTPLGNWSTEDNAEPRSPALLDSTAKEQPAPIALNEGGVIASPTPLRLPPRPEQANQFAPGTYFLVNSRRFRLRYQVAGLREEQVGAIAIFGSTDLGKTWRLWTTDLDKRSPVDISVDDQGRFAFRVVVTSAAGITSEIPQPGTTPELVVDVDLTAPLPRIIAAPYGKDPNQASVLIRWQCDATDLASTPVALAYSHAAAGPWTTITAAAPNTGEYNWELQPNLPSAVFLRMAVRDLAGNQGFHQLEQPINIAPLIPRGRILGIDK